MGSLQKNHVLFAVVTVVNFMVACRGDDKDLNTRMTQGESAPGQNQQLDLSAQVDTAAVPAMAASPAPPGVAPPMMLGTPVPPQVAPTIDPSVVVYPAPSPSPAPAVPTSAIQACNQAIAAWKGDASASFDATRNPYRFGQQILSGAELKYWSTIRNQVFAANNKPSKVIIPDECAPPASVNCGGYDSASWSAPVGCSCASQADGSGERSPKNCKSPSLWACPYASGTGCGLPVPGYACTPSKRYRYQTPQIMNCHVDVQGTAHDFCCAQNWYPSKANPAALNTLKCNGCTGPNWKESDGVCSDTGTVPPSKIAGFNMNDTMPCYHEWLVASESNGLVNQNFYWNRDVDTEQRFNTDEVIAGGGSGAILKQAKIPNLLMSKGNSVKPPADYYQFQNNKIADQIWALRDFGHALIRNNFVQGPDDKSYPNSIKYSEIYLSTFCAPGKSIVKVGENSLCSP